MQLTTYPNLRYVVTYYPNLHRTFAKLFELTPPYLMSDWDQMCGVCTRPVIHPVGQCTLRSGVGPTHPAVCAVLAISVHAHRSVHCPARSLACARFRNALSARGLCTGGYRVRGRNFEQCSRSPIGGSLPGVCTLPN